MTAIHAIWRQSISNRLAGGQTVRMIRLIPTLAKETIMDATLLHLPVIALHLITALGALVIGPAVIWARLGTAGSPVPHLWHRVHRVLSITWVILMIINALSALFIRSSLPNLGGFSAIHLLVPFTLYSLYAAFRYLRQGNITGHRRTLIGLYIGACVVAGAFTLLPSRLLGQMVWGDWLGWL